MENLILINVTFNETRAAFTENGTITELYLERKSLPRIVGNIYKGRVGKVVPGMQAAFIEIGLEKSGFISVEDVHEDSFLELFLEDEEIQTQKRRMRYPIQDMLREGQELLVQVLKEPVGGKGAKLSSYIAIPGKYLVLFGTMDIVGVSRKIEDKDERKRLSDIIERAKPRGIGFIGRTASMGRDESEILEDMQYLARFWEEFKRKADEQKAPALLYEEPGLYIRTVRDLVTNESRDIIVDSKEAYTEISHYLLSRFSGFNVNLELWTGASPLFTHFGLENEIKGIFDKKVWLKSGGYLIIEEAEALTVIDINTGRYLSGNDHEETIFNINIEAAEAAARQIRLRNLVGIIVIDFIDQKNRQKREEVFSTFVENIKKDRARSVILDMSTFGVVQMTRQRTRESLLKSLAETCPCCGGAGYVKSKETVSYEIIREVKSRIMKPGFSKISVRADSSVIKVLKEIEGENISLLERTHGVNMTFDTHDSGDQDFDVTVD